MKRYFEMSCHALILSAFLALVLTGRLDVPSVLLFSVGACASVWSTLTHKPPLIGPRSAFYLSCSYIVFFAIDGLILSHAFIPAIIHLILFLELAKLHQRKTDRDYFYLIVLSFAQILAASSLTIDMTFLFTLLLFLGALVSTLMSFDMHRSERKRAAAVKVSAPLGGMSAWATLWIVVLGTGLFFLIPRIGTGYFSRAASSPLLLSGFNERIELGEIGQVQLSSAVVMHARPLPGTSTAALRWRGIATDTFNGTTWYRSDRTHHRLQNPEEGTYTLSHIENPADAAHYEILLEPLATTALFAPARSRTITEINQGLEADRDGSIYLRFQQVRRLQYQVIAEPQRQVREGEAPPEDRDAAAAGDARYLQLPSNMDARVTRLATQITETGRTPFEKAALTEAYLKRNYHYTLQLNNPARDPIASFLFDTKAGHCEYFASSMALLLRAAGIPTRMVTGFQMGEYNPVGNDFIVRESDAHAWVEAYIPGMGWTEFDPTPGGLPEEPGLGTAVLHYVDAATLYWNSYVLAFDSGAQMELLRNAQENVTNFQNSLRSGSDRWNQQVRTFSIAASAWVLRVVKSLWFWLAAILGSVLVTLFRNRRSLWIEWKVRRLSRGQGDIDIAIVEQLFHRAARLAAQGRVQREAGQTWREWVLDLPRPDSMVRALHVFEQLKYGSQPPSPADFVILQETIRELRSRPDNGAQTPHLT